MDFDEDKLDPLTEALNELKNELRIEFQEKLDRIHGDILELRKEIHKSMTITWIPTMPVTSSAQRDRELSHAEALEAIK